MLFIDYIYHNESYLEDSFFQEVTASCQGMNMEMKKWFFEEFMRNACDVPLSAKTKEDYDNFCREDSDDDYEETSCSYESNDSDDDKSSAYGFMKESCLVGGDLTGALGWDLLSKL